MPPIRSGIDDAPALDKDMRPQIGPQGLVMAAVGSTAVRAVIEKYQPLLALHGHIHESRGQAKIGRTLCLNPGSEYSEGILRGLLVTISGDKVVSHMMTFGCEWGSVRVTLAQLACAEGDLVRNLETGLGAVDEAARLGADCVILPELHLTGFLPADEVSRVAEAWPGEDAR